MKVTLRQMQAFEAVVRLRSFSKAALALNLSQPAVTSSIKELEQTLGVALLDRTTRTVAVTDAGGEFLTDARRLLNDLDAALSRIQELRDLGRGRVRVAALPSVAAHVLPQAVETLRSQSPAIVVEILDGNASAVHALVRDGEVDFAINSLWRDDEELRFDLLMRDRVGVACSVHHALAAEAGPIRLADVRDVDFIGFAADTGLHALSQGRFDADAMNVVPKYRLSSIYTIVGLVRSGLGVAILPELAVWRGESANIAFRPLAEPRIDREIFVCRLRGRQLSPAAKRFLAMIGDAVEEIAPL